MYYICKFSDSWTIYDETTQTSRQLDKNQVESILSLFPAFNNGKILEALHVHSIQPNKLLNLTAAGKNGVVKHLHLPGGKPDTKAA